MTIAKSHWRNFTAAPHRVMFFGGALQSIAVMLWWLVELTTRFGILGHPLTWTIAPHAIHIYLMIYGLLPFFMFGFLMTTFPRFMNGKEIPAIRYIAAFVLLMLGAFTFYVGILVNTILIVSAISTLAGWEIALYALLRVLLESSHPDKRHPIVLFVALVMGWIGLSSYLGWLLTDSASFLSFAIQCGLWLFLLPVFASVAHRMIPFFTSSALSQPDVPRPVWPWWTILAASVAHGLLSFMEATSWLWLCDIPLAVAAFYLSYQWGFLRSFRNPLLAVLHVGFGWISISMLLFIVQSFTSFVTHGTTWIWGLAPLHALTLGCFATLMIGMGTRVTLGHSGLPFNIGITIKLMFVGMQLVTLARILADILPMQNSYLLYIVSALGWLVCFSPWVVRFLPAYWRPRADGQPG